MQSLAVDKLVMYWRFVAQKSRLTLLSRKRKNIAKTYWSKNYNTVQAKKKPANQQQQVLPLLGQETSSFQSQRVNGLPCLDNGAMTKIPVLRWSPL